MLSEFDTAVAVARGVGLLAVDQEPDEQRSQLQAEGYRLVDARGTELALVPLATLRSWIPSQPRGGPDAAPLSVEEVVGGACGQRWHYLVVRLDLREQDRGSVLEQVRLNGQPFDLAELGALRAHQFHDLLDLLGDRGWELVSTTVTHPPAASGLDAYRIIFKRPRLD